MFFAMLYGRLWRAFPRAIWCACLYLALQAEVTAIEATRLPDNAQPMVVDGRLGEIWWAQVPGHDQFLEHQPGDRIPPKVRTEFKIAYDANFLYVAVIAYEPNIAAIRAPQGRRDVTSDDQDWITLYIDPVGSRKFAQVFTIHAGGGLADAVYSEDTLKTDYAPDFAFDGAAHIGTDRWVAEYRIPFTSLRYTNAHAPKFSLLVMRNQPRDARYQLTSTPINYNSDCLICLNEALVLHDLPSVSRFTMTPDIRYKSLSTKNGATTASSRKIEAGLDVKYQPAPGLVIDATINPDFSQVELDTPQLSGNTRFALSVPEKRPFFLEGVDILATPLQLINTRAFVAPDAGVRITSRSADFEYTTLLLHDDGGGSVLVPGSHETRLAEQVESSQAAIVRAKWLQKNLAFGLTNTARQYRNGGNNLVLGADVTWQATPTWRFSGQIAGASNTTGLIGDGEQLRRIAQERGVVFYAETSYRGEHWDITGLAERIGEGFRADSGFIPQANFRHVNTSFARRFGKLGGLDEMSPYIEIDENRSLGGALVSSGARAGINLLTLFDTAIKWELRPVERQQIAPAAGAHPLRQTALMIRSNPSPRLTALRAEITSGDQIEVDSNQVGHGKLYLVSGTWRPTAWLDEAATRQEHAPC
jgi:hypothetical protein